MFSQIELDELEHSMLAQINELPAEALRPQRVTRGRKRRGLDHLGTLPDAGPALLAYRTGTRSIALAWARGFTIKFLGEIRELICERARYTTMARAGGVTAKGAASALAAWLSQAFSVTNPIAIGVATLVLLVITAAAKSAFCQMSEEEIVNQLRR